MDIICRTCGHSKSEFEFFKATKPEYIDKVCKLCKHEAQQNRRFIFKSWCVDYKGGKCQACGYSKCQASLDFHHIDPSTKERNISNRLIKKDKAKKELDKCVLLCRNCHAEVHAGILILDYF